MYKTYLITLAFEFTVNEDGEEHEFEVTVATGYRVFF